MALHNYIYVKHHTDIDIERKIAREHDPRPTLIKATPDIESAQTDNVLLNPHPNLHTHLDIKEDWEFEVKLDKWDDESSSDTDYLRKQLNLEHESGKLKTHEKHHHSHHSHHSHHHHHHSHHNHHYDVVESSESSLSNTHQPKESMISAPLNLSKEDIDLILSAKPMKISRSQQSQNEKLLQPQQQQPLQLPSVDKKPFKDTKFVIIGGKKKKLKSRFARMKKSSSNQGTN